MRWGEGQAAWPNGVKSWSEHLGHFKAGQPSLSLLEKSAAASPALPPKLKRLGYDLAVRFSFLLSCWFFSKSCHCISVQKFKVVSYELI